MSEEEKAIEVLKTVIEVRKFSGIYTSIDTIFEAIETILKLYDDKKEEIYTIAKTNYTVGVLEERNEWFNRINKKFKELTQEEKETDGVVMHTKEKKILQELIGKEE